MLRRCHPLVYTLVLGWRPVMSFPLRSPPWMLPSGRESLPSRSNRWMDHVRKTLIVARFAGGTAAEDIGMLDDYSSSSSSSSSSTWENDDDDDADCPHE